MYQYKMKLTDEQKAILEGKEGEVKAKVMETIVRYGDMFEATELVKVTHGQGHLVTSFGLIIAFVAFIPKSINMQTTNTANKNIKHNAINNSTITYSPFNYNCNKILSTFLIKLYL